MRRCLFCLLALLVVTACNQEFGNDNPNQSEPMLSGTKVKFLRLQDDSTNVAGVLQINARMSSVKLEWDVSPGFNLDTTVTELQLSGGEYSLPIKWAKKLKEGTYGPMYSAYVAGVHIIAGDDSRYVPLVWADEVDSLKMVEIAERRSVLTRGSEEKDVNTEAITILDELPVQLDRDTCGSIHFTFNSSTCAVDKKELSTMNESLGSIFNLDRIKATYYARPVSADLLWATKAPDTNFFGHMKLTSGGLTKFVYFQYKVPTAKKWEFIECIPDSLSELPAKNATVVAVVNTNRQWCMKYRMEDGRDTISWSPKEVNGEQSLILRLPENTTLNSKHILIDLCSEDTIMNTLKFTQKAAEGSFSIIAVKPAPTDGNLSAEAQKIKVTVDTARDWWISYEGIKHNFLASNAEGELQIPAYDGTTSRNVIVTVGYGNTLVETYTYTQVVGDELVYDNSDMPTTIPVAGGTYRFNFHGSYKGNLQVRAVLSNGTVVVTSPGTTNKEPSMVIPDNFASLTDRTLIFQYKKGSAEWAKLKEDDHVQEKATFSHAVLPAGNIPREGTTISGVFSGSYRGSVNMKAVSGSTELASGNSATPGSINLLMPELTGTEDRIIEFLYSLDAGVKWISMGKRTQVAGTINAGTVTIKGNIPAGGGPYSCSFDGTYPGDITFRARTGTTVLASQTGKLPIKFELIIPVNGASDQREVVFEYSKDGMTWITVDTRVQTSKIPVVGGDNNVGDYGDEENITGNKEL